MTVHCAECGAFVCRGGNLEAAPDHCPVRDDFPAFDGLYPEGQVREFLVQSALVEAEGYCRWTRMEEVIAFSRRLGFDRLGLPHCPDMKPTAQRIAARLAEAGIGAVLPPDSTLSDPREQARSLAGAGTELNVLAGMCVGHELLFIRESQAPVVGLVARDTRLRHNPAAGIYTSRSYLKAELFGHWKRKERPTFKGWDADTLLEAVNRCSGPARAPGPNPGPAERHVGEVGAPVSQSTPRSRLAEALDLAHTLGATRLGISFCVGFREEAAVLSKLLKTNGFEVSSACCKTGFVPKEEAGITDAQKVRPGTREMICNPLAQAELLNRDQVHMALVLGQCVGHDAATLQTLDAPAVCLVVKDRVLAHNTIAGIYLP